MAEINCFDCGNVFRVPRAYSGQHTPCPSCGRVVLVPLLSAEAGTAAPATAEASGHWAAPRRDPRPVRGPAALDASAPSRRRAKSRPRTASPRRPSSRGPAAKSPRRRVARSVLTAYVLSGLLGVFTGLAGAHLWHAARQAADSAHAAQTARSQAESGYGHDFAPQAAGQDAPSPPPDPGPAGQGSSRQADSPPTSKLPPDHGGKTIFDF